MDDCIIVGGGVAGLSAAIYTRRYNLATTLFIGPNPGGATATASIIENYPGIKRIDGFQLYQTMLEQAKSLGAKIVPETVKSIHKTTCFSLDTEKRYNYQAKSIILANGTSRRHLKLAREDILTGKGVSYCATCDAPLYKDKVVAVVGGGDASLKGVLIAAQFARHVYFITREAEFTGEPINTAKVTQLANITHIPQTTVTELIGSDTLIGIKLSQAFQGSAILNLDGLFIEIGADPDVHLAKSLGVKTDTSNHIDVNKLMQTNIEGIFAAGDITNGAGDFWQDIVAAAQGATAATSAFRYVSNHPAGCFTHGHVSAHHQKMKERA